MRLFLSSLLVLLLCTCARAQVGVSVDQEYVQWCMVDSLPGGVVRFQRVLLVASRDVIDIGADGSPYTPAGVTLTCEAYDLRETTRDPLEDLYDNCECIYTTSQEENRTLSIEGDTTQEYTVEFQEVVRRRCGSQTIGTVVSRDTLTRTQAIPATMLVSYGWTFTATGQYVDRINLRGYASGTVRSVVIDLNPSTVQSSYPSLTLDPADFSYNGSNISDMAAAYLVVVNSAVEDAFGTPVNTITTFGNNSTVSIRTQLMHEPPEPYVITPRPGDADYSVVSTVPNGTIGLGYQGGSLVTRTNDYTEECETIFETRTGQYLTWSQDTPRDLLPISTVTTTQRPNESNISAFCDVSPAICDALTPDVITLGGECIETCSDVANVGGHQGIRDEDITYEAQEYNSVSVWVTSGSVGVVLDGVRINYPAGSITSWSAQEGKLLQNSIRFDASDGGEGIISFVR